MRVARDRRSPDCEGHGSPIAVRAKDRWLPRFYRRPCCDPGPAPAISGGVAESGRRIPADQLELVDFFYRKEIV